MKRNKQGMSHVIRSTIIVATIAATAVVSLGLTSSYSHAQTATPGSTTTATPSPVSTSASTSTAAPTSRATSIAADVPTMTVSIDTITVDGIGQATSAPDSAIVELGVQNRAVTASVALSQTSLQVGALISALQATGVQQSDIQTLNVSLFPVYDQPQNPNDPATLSGFNATNIVRVRVRNLDSLGDLLDSAIAAGANTIQSIQLELSDPTATQDDARTAAVDDARRKAEQLASLAGRELGAIRAIVESSSPPPGVLAEGRGGFAAAVPIAPGTQNVQVTVQVTWQLR